MLHTVCIIPMNSHVKGERLFGWNTMNLMNFVQESYVFHLINIKNHVGFFYDISPIDSKLFWKRWDLRRMGAINEFTDKLWRDHRIERTGFHSDCPPYTGNYAVMITDYC